MIELKFINTDKKRFANKWTLKLWYLRELKFIDLLRMHWAKHLSLCICFSLLIERNCYFMHKNSNLLLRFSYCVKLCAHAAHINSNKPLSVTDMLTPQTAINITKVSKIPTHCLCNTFLFSLSTWGIERNTHCNYSTFASWRAPKPVGNFPSMDPKPNQTKQQQLDHIWLAKADYFHLFN